MNKIMQSSLKQVSEFWFAPGSSSKWYAKDAEFDEKIRSNFKELCDNILDIPTTSYEDDPKQLVAAIIVMDQFSRNLYRGSKDAFKYDSSALELAKKAVQKELDKQLTNDERLFLYMPFEHSECMADQLESLRLCEQLAPEYYRYAVLHKNVIEKFGRFPHRNAALGRESTSEEEEYFREKGNTF